MLPNITAVLSIILTMCISVASCARVVNIEVSPIKYRRYFFNIDRVIADTFEKKVSIRYRGYVLWLEMSISNYRYFVTGKAKLR